mgnify:CR=1 FL=1
MTHSTVTQLSDRDLLRNISEDDPFSWNEIVLRYRDTVYSLLHYMLRDKNDVDDAFQNTFIKIRKSAGGFRYGKDARKWIKTIASREALQMLNQRKKNTHSSLNTDASAPPAENTAGKDRVSEKEIQNLVRREIERLPEILRTTLVMKFASEMTQEEIAEETRANQSTISHRLQKGLSTLRNRLSTAGVRDARILGPFLVSELFIDHKAPAELVRKVSVQNAARRSARIARYSKHPAKSKVGIFTAAVMSCAAVGAVFLGYISSRPDQPLRQNQTVAVSNRGKISEEHFFDFETDKYAKYWKTHLISGRENKLFKISPISAKSQQIQVRRSARFGTASNVLQIRKDPDSDSFPALIFHKSIPEKSRLKITADLLAMSDATVSFKLASPAKLKIVNVFHQKHSSQVQTKNEHSFVCAPVKYQGKDFVSVKQFIGDKLLGHDYIAVSHYKPALVVTKGKVLFDNIRFSFEVPQPDKKRASRP